MSKKYTVYQIINNGLSIAPELNRDNYYKKEFVEAEELEKVNLDTTKEMKLIIKRTFGHTFKTKDGFDIFWKGLEREMNK